LNVSTAFWNSIGWKTWKAPLPASRVRPYKKHSKNELVIYVTVKFSYVQNMDKATAKVFQWIKSPLKHFDG